MPASVARTWLARTLDALIGVDATDAKDSLLAVGTSAFGASAVSLIARPSRFGALAIAGPIARLAAQTIEKARVMADHAKISDLIGRHRLEEALGRRGLAEVSTLSRDGALATEADGAWYVRKQGADHFIRMEESEYRSFEAETARNGGLLYQVKAVQGGVALVRRVGGVVDGAAPQDPAMVVERGEETIRHYYHKGTNITGEVERSNSLAAKALAAAVVGAVMMTPAAATAEPNRTVVFGDSLSVGTAAHLRSSGTVTDLGVVGWGLTHANWQQRLQTLRAAAQGAGRVVIFLGANDQRSLPAITEGARENAAFGSRKWQEAYIVRLGQTRMSIPPGVPVLWIGQPEFCDAAFNQRAQRVDRVVRFIAEAAGDQFITPPGDCSPAVRSPDGIHFTPRGYRNIAQAVEQTSNRGPRVAEAQTPATRR